MEMSSYQPLQEKRYSRFIRKCRKKKSNSKDRTNPKLANHAKSTLVTSNAVVNKNCVPTNGVLRHNCISKFSLRKSKRKLFSVSHRRNLSSNLLESNNSCINVIKSVASKAMVSKRKPSKPARAGIFMFGKQSEYKKRDVPLNKLTKARLDGDLQKIIRLSNGLNESLVHDITKPIIHKNARVSKKSYYNSPDVDSPPSQSDTHPRSRSNSSSPRSSESGIRFSPTVSSTQIVDEDRLSPGVNTLETASAQHRDPSELEEDLALSSSSSEISFEENDDRDYLQFASMISESVVEITQKFPHVFGPPRSCIKETQDKLRQLFCERATDDEEDISPAYENQSKAKRDAAEQVPTVRKEHMQAYVLLTPLHKKSNTSTQTTVNILKKSYTALNSSEEYKENRPRVSVQKVPAATSADRNSGDIFNIFQPDSNSVLSSSPPTPAFPSTDMSIDTILDPVKFLKMNFEDATRARDKLLMSDNELQKNKATEQAHRRYREDQLYNKPSFHSVVEHEEEYRLRQNTQQFYCKRFHEITLMDDGCESMCSVPKRESNNSAECCKCRDASSTTKSSDVRDMKMFSYENILTRAKKTALRDQTNNLRYSSYVPTYDSIYNQSKPSEVGNKAVKKKSPSPDLIYQRCKMY